MPNMSSHYGHHRSSHHHSRSRIHHYQSSNRSRNSSSNIHDDHNTPIANNTKELSSSSDWTKHRSSTGKVYYYNAKTGVSQWEIPAELRQQQQPTSPESELSESSSIRQQQDKSPGSSASAHSESVPDDKPLLTPGLAHYFKPELIQNFNSSQCEEIERQANQCARDALLLSEKILKESVDIKIAKAYVYCMGTKAEAQEIKYATLKAYTNSHYYN